MWSITTIVLLLFLSLTCAFKNILVLVVQENAYVSAIQGKGQLTDYSYGDLNSSVVSLLKSKSVSWKIYTDDYVKCDLAEFITAKYPYLVSPSDVADTATMCEHVADSNALLDSAMHKSMPTISFYFPNHVNASSASWLRAALYPAFASTKYLANTLTVIMTPGKTPGHASALVIGKDALSPPDFSLNTTWWDSLRQHFVGLTWVPPPPPNPKWFDKVFTIVLENQPLKSVLRNSILRYFAAQGTLLLDFNAAVNPSQPNYFALTAGDVLGVKDDEVYDLDSSNIIDLFEEKGVSWKAYMENYPENCYSGKRSEGKLYVRKHNPFMSYNNVRENATRCAKIVNSDQLYIDLTDNVLPKYMFYTPNMDNNGHDTSLGFAARWLYEFLVPLLKNEHFMRNTLVVVTYDEGIAPDNRIYTLFLGDMIPFGNVDNTSYTHYSLLRLIEDQYGLASLNRSDSNAPVINRRNFKPGEIPLIRSKLGLYVGLGVGGVLVVSAVVASVYYLAVIRRRAKRAAPFVALKDYQRTDSDDDEYDDDEDDEEVKKDKVVQADREV